jgi:hypothetical protein
MITINILFIFVYLSLFDNNMRNDQLSRPECRINGCVVRNYLD